MPFNVQAWDERVRRDLNARIANYDSNWQNNYQRINNEGTKVLDGNLMREFVKVFFARVVARHPIVKVSADDNTYVDEAEAHEVVANAVMRIIDFKEVLEEAAQLSTWQLGWLWCGHPIAQFNIDPKYSPQIQNNVIKPPDYGNEQYEEVDPQFIVDQGYQLEDIDPLEYNPDEPVIEEKPRPVFKEAGAGFPYLEAVDGRQIVTPQNIRSFKDGDYVARLYCLTKAEIEAISEEGLEFPSDADVMPTKFRKLFPDIDFSFIGEHVYLVIDCWVKRDRSDFNYNNWRAAWVYNNDKIVIRNQPNPYGGMIPCEPVQIDKSGNLLRRSFVEDLRKVAELYSVTLKSIERDMLDSINPKVLEGQGAKIAKSDAENLLNPTFRGKVKVGNVEQVKIERGPGMDQNKLMYLKVVRQLAQQASATSELDAGQPIKKITARQTEALVDSTAAILESVRELVGKSAARIVLKVMYLLTLFNGETKQYKFEDKSITWSPQTADFTANLLYSIDVEDMGPAYTESKIALGIQYIRTLGMNERVMNEFDTNKIAKWLAKLGQGLGLDASVVINHLQTPDMEKALQGVDGVGDNVVSIDRAMERAPGDQGQTLDQANYMSGALRGM